MTSSLIFVCYSLSDCFTLSIIKTRRFYLRLMRVLTVKRWFFGRARQLRLDSSFCLGILKPCSRIRDGSVSRTCEAPPFQRVTDGLSKQSAKADGILRFGCQLGQLDIGDTFSNTYLQSRAEVKVGNADRGQRSGQSRGADL